MTEFTFEYDGDEGSVSRATMELSMRELRWNPSLEVPNPLVGCNAGCDSFKMLTEAVGIVDEVNFTMECDMLPESYEALEVMTEMCKKITNYDYMAIPVREKQGEISLAMASPLIGFLDKTCANLRDGANVLIIGAGVGKDIVRLKTSMRRHGKGYSLTCVEPSVKAVEKLNKWFPHTNMVNDTFHDGFPKVRKHGPYDLILANMSIHYVMGVGDMFQTGQMLHSVLAPGGVLYGSYVDVPSVKMSGEGLNLKCGHSVMYVGEEYGNHYGRAPVNSIVRIAVGGVVWRDPWLSTEQYYKAFERYPVAVQIFDGTQMLYTTDVGPLYPTPSVGFYKKPKRPEVSVHRSLIVVNRVDVTLVDIPGVPMEIRDVPEDGLAMRHRSVPYNKGVPYTSEDIEYLNKDLVWMAEKVDGICVKLMHSARSLTYAHGDVTVRFKNFTSPYTKDFILQGELLEVDDKREIVITDVLVAPWGSCGNFISRWKWLETVHALGGWPFRLQRWVNLDSDDARIMLADVAEGVVLQSLTASPSAIVKGAGSARYVKRKYTLDVVCGGRIVETTLNGDYIRDRPDKDKPNPPAIVEVIKRAIPLDVFSVMMGLKSTVDPYVGEIAYNIREQRPIVEWTVDQRNWFWLHRGDPVLERACGNAVFPYYSANVSIMLGENTKMIEMQKAQQVRFLGADEDYVPGYDGGEDDMVLGLTFGEIEDIMNRQDAEVNID